MSIEKLKEEAMKQPGVAEVMEVYSRADALVAYARPYLRNQYRKVAYTTSDTSGRYG